MISCCSGDCSLDGDYGYYARKVNAEKRSREDAAGSQPTRSGACEQPDVGSGVWCLAMLVA
jgi:hypothetical protein